MISFAPGSKAYRALALIVRTPGITSRDLTAELKKPERRTVPFKNAQEYREFVAERAAFMHDAELEYSRLMGRLQEAGFIETRTAPTLSPGAVAWLESARARVMAEWRALRICISRTTEPTEEEAKALAVRMLVTSHFPKGSDRSHLADLVSRLTVEKPPRTRDALLGSASGARIEAYDELVKAGVITPPSHRHPTALGVEHVRKHQAPT
jgi:hypothetical protein